MSEPALRVLPGGELAPGAPSYGEISDRLDAAEELNMGQEATIKMQASKIGRLERRLTEDDPDHHPQRKEITDLIDRWKERCNHPNAKASKDRFDLIRARLKDGYSLDDIALAIDGLASAPYVVNAQRQAQGKPSQRYDQLEHALKSGSKLEQMANLGHRARRQG